MRIRLSIVLFTLVLGTALIASAQQQPGYVPLADATQAPMLQSLYNSGNLAGFINTLFKVALSVGAILAVLRIAYAGYLYMGSDFWGDKTKARMILGNVVLGLLLLLTVYLILYQINPDILRLDILRDIPQLST